MYLLQLSSISVDTALVFTQDSKDARCSTSMSRMSIRATHILTAVPKMQLKLLIKTLNPRFKLVLLCARIVSGEVHVATTLI